MSLLPRSVPIRYERDFWPTSYERRMPIYHDSFPSYDYRYSTSMQPSMASYRDPIPFEYERPLQETRVMPSSFDHEMRRMNDEMKRMCDSMTRSVAVAPAQPPILPTVDDWRLTENFRMDNPIIQERDGSRKFYLEFDVAQFKPEEITVKTTGNQLSVHARHEDKNDPNRSAYREFARQYVIPKEVRPDFLTSKLSERGKLTIEAPLPALTGGRDKLIPIEHRK
ncbi:unnamed protein product [Mytilus coruscus]|uniref:SHSP domain-containing protein n=1 Tax=Mytilus coruscus TaxID=42192 RepID=A0A6J8AVT0_MYTCO|nr:unnamed protein product [Mytilus coruscus]